MKEITRSDLKGAFRLRSPHSGFSFNKFKAFDATHKLAERWGFASPELAWANDPWLRQELTLKLIASGLDMHYVDYRERAYATFHVDRDPASGPGWYIFGRHKVEYVGASGSGGLIHLCGRPNVPRRASRSYNKRVRPGWAKKADAQAVCDLLNQGYTVQPRGGAQMYALQP